MKIATAVILYNPDIKLPERILSYSECVSKVYVFDNTEDNLTSYNSCKVLLENPKFKYFHDGENKGISIRLNQAAEMALKEGFEWLLTMDQDSFFLSDSFVFYLNCVNNFNDKETTGMFGVQYEDVKLLNEKCDYDNVPHLITSGSILNLSIYKMIGGFDEALFIDKVDHEYCLRALANNFKIIRFNNIFLNHSLGNVFYFRSLKNFEVTPRILHSPLRMYYIVRNYFYLKEKYKEQFPESFKEMKNEIFNRTKNNLLYGKQKIMLLKYIFRGYLDYRLKKMGKFKS